MTRHVPLPDDESRQADRLDAFLDRLVGVNPAPSPNLDPWLAATARHVHELASDSVAADIRSGGKARRWEHLMQTPMKPSVVTPFPLTRTLPPSTPMSIPPRPANRPSRLRRLGSGSVGLVATLTLVLLVAASSLAVYLSAPRGGDEPTMLPAAFGATPEGTPSSSSEVTGVPDDLVYPILSDCTYSRTAPSSPERSRTS